MTTIQHVMISAALAVVAVTIGTSATYAQGCQELWTERNAYYKDAGYCFKTARAIRTFGNAGCRYDDEYDLPLPRGVRNRIAQIVRLERAMGCR